MKKQYKMIGSCPIIVDGYGRVEPNDPPSIFICKMDPGQEAFFVKIGAVSVLAIVSEDAAESKPSKPSSPAWPGEPVLDTYSK